MALIELKTKDKESILATSIFDQNADGDNNAATQPSLPLQRPVVTRDGLQGEAVKCLMENHRLLLEWGTSVGKSRVGVKSIETLMRKGRKKALLLVAQSPDKANWRNEFVKAIGEHNASIVYRYLTVECYQSLPKYHDTSWDIIVADEAHHLRSDNRTDIISTMRADYFLAISATISDKGDAENLLNTLTRYFGPFEKRKFSVQNGITAGFIGEPKIFVHVLSLDLVKRTQVVCVEWGVARFREEIRCSFEEFKQLKKERYLHKNVKAYISCTAEQGYKILCDEMNSRNEEIKRLKDKIADEKDEKKRVSLTTFKGYKENELKNYGSRRKKFLGNCKTDFAKWLLYYHIRKKKYVCFCTDIEQAKEIGGDNAISSIRRDNAAVINDFNNGVIRSIFAVEMIKEGANLTGIQAGLIIELDGKERQFIQKFGRVLRADSPEQHIVVMKCTKDEDYYLTAMENIDRRYIKIIKYS